MIFQRQIEPSYFDSPILKNGEKNFKFMIRKILIRKTSDTREREIENERERERMRERGKRMRE